MPKITFELTDTEAMVLAHTALDPLDFIENIVTWQARIAMDEIADAEIQRMIDDPNTTSIPATKEEIVTAAIANNTLTPLGTASILRN